MSLNIFFMMLHLPKKWEKVYLLVTKWLRSCLNFTNSTIPASFVGPEIMMKLYNAENASVCIRNCQCKAHYTPNQHVITSTLKTKYRAVFKWKGYAVKRKLNLKSTLSFCWENNHRCKSRWNFVFLFRAETWNSSWFLI